MQLIEFVKNIKTYGLEFYKKYYSNYPGIVTDNKDPDKMGRVLVELPTILGPNKIHPKWVIPLDQKLAGKSTGQFDAPYIGQTVNVGFHYGHLDHPFYFGGSFAVGELPADFIGAEGDYPNIRGWVLASGQKFIINEVKGKEKISLISNDGSRIDLSGVTGAEAITITHKQGSKINFNAAGDIIISDKGGKELVELKSGEININSGGKININAEGDATVVAKGKINVEGQEVTISGKSKVIVGGKSGTDLGDPGGQTTVQGSQVQIANGAFPVARLTSQAIGVGNLGGPVVSMIIDGSPTVLVP